MKLLQNLKCINIDKLGRHLVYILLIYNVFIKLLISLNFLPYFMNYLNDVLLIFGIILSGIKIFNLYKEKKVDKNFNILIVFLAILFIFCLLSTLVGGGKITLFLWHIRNNYRIFFFFIMCYLFLNKVDIEKLMNFSFYIVIFHTLLATIQLIVYYLIYHVFYFQDHINGVFGTTKGYNTYSIAFLLGVTAFYVFKYILHDIAKKRVVILLFCSGWVTAISELKIFYIFLVLLLFFVVFFIKKTFRK